MLTFNILNMKVKYLKLLTQFRSHVNILETYDFRNIDKFKVVIKKGSCFYFS